MKKLLLIAVVATHLFAFINIEPSCCKNKLIEIQNFMEFENPIKVNDFYRNNRYKLVWDEVDLNDFLDVAESPIVNYLSVDYHQDEIRELMDSMDGYEGEEQKRIRSEVDILATDGFFSLAFDLTHSFIDWQRFQTLLKDTESNIVWEKNPKLYNYSEDLRISLKTDMLEALLQKYLPVDDQYKKLVKAYHRLGSVKFPTVDYGKLMRVGDYGYRASQLKAFLVATGDLKSSDKDYIEFPTFDQKLSNALKTFQKRHYLKPTGELDRVTVLYSRITAKKKQELVKLNIERHKLFSRIYDSEYIVINIPEFSLKYYQNGIEIDDIFVVVGREDRPTPIFSDYLEYIVLNPSWVVPQGLMRKDYIPMLVDNPYAMKDQNIHIHTKPSRYSPEVNPENVDWSKYLEEGKHIPYYFMQYPGDDNVLGKMKFIFPNKYNVYLHDTNSKSLTTLKYRLYSSGCIRLSKPYELLDILAQHTKYTSDELVELISSGKTTNIRLKKRIPIYIRYFTVFIDKDVGLSFRKDFYGIDALQLPALTK